MKLKLKPKQLVKKLHSSLRTEPIEAKVRYFNEDGLKLEVKRYTCDSQRELNTTVRKFAKKIGATKAEVTSK